MRIAKFLSHAGLCSRRQAESWIEAGRVSVNGKVLDSPALVVGDDDVVLVDGKPVSLAAHVPMLWRYHKDAGVMTTNSDPEGRPTLFERLSPELPRVVTVGRLDYMSEGLILLTNNGDLARHLELPANGWIRRYRVRAFGQINDRILEAIRRGPTVDKVQYKPIEIEVESVASGMNSWLNIALQEGKNREIRKVLAHFDLQVNRLIRLSYGPFLLGSLPKNAAAEIPPKAMKSNISGFFKPKNATPQAVDQHQE
ncbi:MAG: pseudouridine synthase [Alphaproteobacteria bacterium]